MAITGVIYSMFFVCFLLFLCCVQQEDDAAVELAFSKLDGTVATDRRKRWLEKYQPSVFVDRSAATAFLTYADFVNKDLVAYMYYSNLRAIPRFFPIILQFVFYLICLFF